MKRDFLVLKSSLNHLIFLKIPEKILVKILKGKVIFLYGFQKVELDNFENLNRLSIFVKETLNPSVLSFERPSPKHNCKV
jgi:hypothetical protein